MIELFFFLATGSSKTTCNSGIKQLVPHAIIMNTSRQGQIGKRTVITYSMFEHASYVPPQLAEECS